MALTDLFLNKSAMREERDQAIDVAREQYDPSVYQPQLNLARERATEGISEGQESLQRRRALEQIFRPQDTAIYGGNQARAIAGQQQRNQQAQQAFSDFQSRLTEADLQAQRQGQQQFAQTRSQQLQTQAQQDAAIEQAELQYQQELERRRQSIGSTIGNIAGTVAGTALGGPLAGAAVGGGLGAIFGGGSGALTGAGAGATTGMTQQRLDEFNANQQAQQEAGTQNQTPNWMGMLGGYDTGRQQTQPQQQTPNWMGMLGGFDQVQPQQSQGQQVPQAPQTPFISPQQPQDKVIPANLDWLDQMGDMQVEPMEQPEDWVDRLGVIGTLPAMFQNQSPETQTGRTLRALFGPVSSPFIRGGEQFYQTLGGAFEGVNYQEYQNQ